MDRDERVGLGCEHFDLDSKFPTAHHLRALGERMQGASSVVGVGLAATWLLNIGGRLPGADGVPMLALFPYLGVDAAPYDAHRYSTWRASQWLRLAQSWPLRHVMAAVAITPRPRGLEGVYAPRRLSWTDASAALDRPDFAALVLAPVSAITVVLNASSADLLPERAKAVLTVMNSHITVDFAKPNADEVCELVRQWAVRCQSNSHSKRSVGNDRSDPDV